MPEDPNVNPDGKVQPPKDNGANDLQIENNALKELLAENKKTMDALNKELTAVKTVNAKMLNQLSVEKPKPTVESLLNDNFNKYNKKG